MPSASSCIFALIAVALMAAPSLAASARSASSRAPTSPSSSGNNTQNDPVCVMVGLGPIRQRKPPVKCLIPFTVQQTAKAQTVTFNYCASLSDAQPKGYNDAQFAVNKTSLWCPALPQGTVYRPYDNQIDLQWAWCECDRPRSDQAACALRGGVDLTKLQAWHPEFPLGNEGDACIFPFVYKGTTYYECAEKVAKDPLKQYGWCFSNITAQTFGSCACTSTLPPTFRPTSLAPTRPIKFSQAPTTARPTVASPSHSPQSSRPSANPTPAPSAVPTAAPTLPAMVWDLVLIVNAPVQNASTHAPTSQPSAAGAAAGATAAAPTPGSRLLQQLRGLALDLAPPDFNLAQFTRGLSCLLQFTLLAAFTANTQFAFSVTSPVDCNGGLKACWPKLVHAYLFTPDLSEVGGSDQTLAFYHNVSRLLRDTSSALYTPGLWKGGVVVYSESDDLAVSQHTLDALTSHELAHAPAPAVCGSDYLNTSVLAAPPIASSGADGLSSGAAAGVALGVLACVALLGVAVFVAVDDRRRRRRRRSQPAGSDSSKLLVTATASTSWASRLFLGLMPSHPPASAAAVAAQASSSPHTLQSQPSYVNEFSIDLSELRLGKVIGQGGNGRIFQAQYAGSAVAVKELFASTSGQDGSTTVDVLFREFNSLRVLKHPHIIQIFGLAVASSAETGSPRYLLVMELADTSLDKVLPRKAVERGNGTDCKPWALEVAKQTASGLAFVHDRGIIHFDVKPHNILLDRSGSVKLCDLGISRLAPTSRHGGTASAAAGDAAQEPALMKASVQAGTPSYMAPELIRGDGALVGPAVDVFAFGIVLWQLYHLQPPHPKDWTVGQLFEAVLSQAHRPAIDDTMMPFPALQALAQKCWAEDVSTRPTFKQVVHELSLLNSSVDEGRVVEAVRYANGDRVRVYSAAVRELVPGIVQIPPEAQSGRKHRFYDVLLNDGSLMVGVGEADLFPPAPLITPTARPGAVSVNPLGLDATSTLADVASALAMEKRGFSALKSPSGASKLRTPQGSAQAGGGSKKSKFLNRIWKMTTSDSDTESNPGDSPMLSTSGKVLDGASPRRQKRRARLSMDERATSSFAGGSTGDDTRLSLDDSHVARGTMDFSAATSPPPSAAAGLALPALTPFSFRFLPVMREERQDAEAAAAAAAAGAATGLHLSTTFHYDGARLDLPGLVLSATGIKLNGDQVCLPGEEMDDAAKFREGSVRVAELGRGASGIVYSALVLSTFHIVAVKEVRFADRSARHQVIRELKALVKMDSPHVVKMLGAHLDASSECVAMVLEYVNGGSLQDFIHVARGERILPESALANIARDISRALAYCHGLNMLHLDVKPSNILLGLDGTAKLADFGLARQMDMNKKAATFVGTTKYLSPERLRGEEYSFPADVWGLGLCLLTAALGEYPFDSKDAKRSEQNEQGVYWSLLERLEKSSMAQLPHELFSTQATEFCAACMELDPALRPTALALCDSAWFEGRSEARRLEKRPRKDAAIAVLAEVCDAIVKALGKMHTSEVNVETGLVLNLARQLSVSEEEVRLALEASAARLSAQTPVESVLSGRAKDSTGSSFAANRSTTPFSPNTGVSLS